MDVRHKIIERKIVSTAEENNEDYGKPNSCKWEHFTRLLSDLVIWGDVKNFLNWKILKSTMFIDPPKEVHDYVEALSDWKDAIVESPVGNPAHNGNIIFQAYRLHMTKSMIGCDYKELDSIIEFGGGYGCACRLTYRLGFDGIYMMYDFPMFLALQKYYLSRTEIYPKNNIIFQPDVDKFKKRIVDNKGCRSMFIASFSLSEAPFSLRDEILSVVCKSINYISIWYQREYYDYDNHKYFSDWKNAHSNYNWKHEMYRSDGGLYYLIGIKK